jgi:hypothetical protein
MEIKKGDQFLCIKSLRDSIEVEGYGTIRSVSFEQGKVYTSERDGEITDDNGQGVYWRDDSADEHFEKLLLATISPYDFIEDYRLGFHLGNAVKVIAGAEGKTSREEIADLEMAKFYLNRRISQLKKQEQ